MLKKTIMLLASLVYLTACTYSITMVHTQGEANDVVDTSQTSKSDVSPDIKIPLP